MQILLVLCLMTACLAPWPEPPADLGVGGAVTATAGLTAVMVAASTALSLTTVARLRSRPDLRTTTLRRFLERRQHLFLATLAAFGVMLGGLGWGWASRELCTADGKIAPGAELLLLAPFLVMILGGWFWGYGVERAAWESSPLRPPEPRFSSRLGYVGYHLRSNLVTAVAPLAILVVLQGVVRGVPALSEADSARFFVLALIPAVPALLAVAPWFIKWGLGLKPMPPGPIRDRLEAASRRLCFRCSDLLVWDTRGETATAAVFGVLPAPRYVVFTDRLLEELDPEELEAVLGHEVGHIMHGHLLHYAVFLTLSVATLFVGFTLLADRVGLTVHPRDDLSAVAGWLELLPVAVLVPYLFVVFGFLSRRCERQADVYGARSVSCGRPDCTGLHRGEPLVPAAAALCPAGIRTFVRVLDRVSGGNGIAPRERAGLMQEWLHSSVDRRIGFLERLIKEPSAEPRFQREVWLLRWGLIVGLTAVFAGLVAVGGAEVVWRSL
jgi:Zn-dependent protease with chaperone function